MTSSACVGQNYYTYLCFLISTFLCLCPWVDALSSPRAMECHVSKSCQHSVFLYLLGILQLDFGKQMNYELLIYCIVLIYDSANSCNFTDCV